MKMNEQHLGGVQVERNLAVTTRDGVRLATDVYRPTSEGTYPVLLLRTPYDRALAQNIVYQHPAWYARHGYIVVAQDVRGRVQSDGVFYPFRNEAQDGADTVDWARRLRGSTGAVGTYGFSYPGAVQLMAAAERPAGLRCIAPGFTAGDYYENWIYQGGAFRLAATVSWVVQYLAAPDALKSGHPDEAAEISRLAQRVRELYGRDLVRGFDFLRDGRIEYFFDWVTHSAKDEYWDELAVAPRFEAIDVPSLHVGGWYDTFLEGTLRNYIELSGLESGGGRPCQRLIIGPWVHIPWSQHVGGFDFGAEGRNIVDEFQLLWFDEWLKGAEYSETIFPAVNVFTMGVNRWRSYDAWPPREARYEDWYLRSEGRAASLSGDGLLAPDPPASEPPDVFAYDPGNPVPSFGGRSCCSPDVAPMGPADQRAVETRNDVLVYTSPPLTDPLEICGQVEVVLYAATDAPDTDWTVKLVDVFESGFALNLCDGIVRARYRESLRAPRPLEPNRVYEYRISVGSTANVFRPGHSIRLEVSSSNWPAYDVNPNTGIASASVGAPTGRVATQAVFHDSARKSRLILPVIRR